MAPKMRAQDSYVREVEATALDLQPLELAPHLLQTVHYVLHLGKYLPGHLTSFKKFVHHYVLQCEEG